MLLDLPYFTNVGDVLIWQSTLDLLAELPCKCVYSASIESYRYKEVDDKTVILFMGGGNFGDLWKRHQVFRQRVLKEYPHNPIIQLPQSVFFSDMDFLKEDISIFTQHKGSVTLCARDQKSYDFFAANYQGAEAVLLPDMVLSLDIERYALPNQGKGCLFVKREDSEKNSVCETIIPNEAVVSDWPTMKEPTSVMKVYCCCLSQLMKIDRFSGTHFTKIFADVCYKKYFKKYIIQSGLRFVNAYASVYTTRLHVGIVAALLGKDTVMFDNSYGKIKGVYDLWMNDWNNVKMR